MSYNYIFLRQKKASNDLEIYVYNIQRPATDILIQRARS